VPPSEFLTINQYAPLLSPIHAACHADIYFNNNNNTGVLVHRFYKIWKQPTLLNKTQSLSELRLVYTIAGRLGKPNRRPRGLIPNRRFEWRNV
jgi:hypothetical protein